MVEDGRFDPEVVGHDPSVPSNRGHLVWLVTGNGGHQVDPVGTSLSGRSSHQAVLVDCAERPGHGA